MIKKLKNEEKGRCRGKSNNEKYLLEVNCLLYTREVINDKKKLK
jgi:hypothetical protein